MLKNATTDATSPIQVTVIIIAELDEIQKSDGAYQ